jgi:hypothetical protein
MRRLVYAMGRLLELNMWNRQPFMSASKLGTGSYAMQGVVKVLAEAPYWQTIEMYWNTAMDQNNIWSIAFEAHSKQIMTEV